jgi:hypothetical protein
MIIRLIQPPTKNWLLIAEQLDDPSMWDRFVPCHTADSQRWRFDCVVKESCSTTVKLKPCKEMLTRGVSVFEYDWNAGEDDILAHAMQVADLLGLDLSMDESRSAA